MHAQTQSLHAYIARNARSAAKRAVFQQAYGSNQQTLAQSLHTPASRAMPKTIITVDVRVNVITATTMGGRELVRSTEDLRGNELASDIEDVLGEGAKFKMISTCGQKISGDRKKIRAQLRRLVRMRRWHPLVFRVDPRQRLINRRAEQRADPVWKTRFPLDPPNDEYVFVYPDGEIEFGALRGALQEIPFDLGEELKEAVMDATRLYRRRPDAHERLIEAARRVREWRP